VVPFACLILGYLLGSIPFGLLLTRAAGTQDLRALGSGRKDLAALTLLLDALKGTAAVLIARWIAEGYAGGDPLAPLLAATGAFLGHVFPVWLKFSGGKGVATFLGCLIGLAWPAGLAFALIWLSIAFLTRYSSAAALTASALSPLVLWLLDAKAASFVFLVLAAILWIKHRANIARLRTGEETKIGSKG